MPLESVVVVVPASKVPPEPVRMVQVTDVPATGIPLGSVTCTVIGAKKPPAGVLNCPFPEMIVMFAGVCADAGLTARAASIATETSSLVLFKMTSSFEA